MRLTLSIPDDIAERFQAIVPARNRSSLVTKLLIRELEQYEDKLIQACHAANNNKDLNSFIDEWQSFDDDSIE